MPQPASLPGQGGVEEGCVCVVQEVWEFQEQEGHVRPACLFFSFVTESGVLLSEISERQQNKSDLGEKTDTK